MNRKLAAWLVLIGAQILLAYSVRVSSGKPDRNAVYHYSLAAGALIEYGIVLAIVLAIAGSGRGRELLALRQPRSWRVAVTASVGVIVGIYVLVYALDPFLHAGREQGLTPTGWQPGHVGAFAASFVVLALVGPFVEEATFRGLGYSLLAPFGQTAAIVAIGVLFGLAHGLVESLPVLVALGAALAWMRARTDSLYPCVILHGVFNTIALVGSVTT